MCDLVAQSKLVFQAIYICVDFRHPYIYTPTQAIIWIYSFSSNSAWCERLNFSLEQQFAWNRLVVIC